MPELEGIRNSYIGAFFQFIFPFTLFPILMVSIILFFWLLAVLTIKCWLSISSLSFLTDALALSFSYLIPLLFFFCIKANNEDKTVGVGERSYLRKGKRKAQVLEIVLWSQFGEQGFKSSMIWVLLFVEEILGIQHLKSWWHKHMI